MSSSARSHKLGSAPLAPGTLKHSPAPSPSSLLQPFASTYSTFGQCTLGAQPRSPTAFPCSTHPCKSTAAYHHKCGASTEEPVLLAGNLFSGKTVLFAAGKWRCPSGLQRWLLLILANDPTH